MWVVAASPATGCMTRARGGQEAVSGFFLHQGSRVNIIKGCGGPGVANSIFLCFLFSFSFVTTSPVTRRAFATELFQGRILTRSAVAYWERRGVSVPPTLDVEQLPEKLPAVFCTTVFKKKVFKGRFLSSSWAGRQLSGLSDSEPGGSLKRISRSLPGQGELFVLFWLHG